MKFDFSKIKKITETKKGKIFIASALVLLAVFVYFLPQNSSKTKIENISNTTEEKTNEKKLEEVLSSIKGAGEVKVMITYFSSDETVTAMNSQKQTSTTTETTESGTRTSQTTVENSTPMTVGSGGSESAFVLKNNEPEIKGVIVVAQGAQNLSVRLELEKAVETVLQILPSQVEIFTMN